LTTGRAVLVLTLSLPLAAQQNSEPKRNIDNYKQGHSHLGEAFDTGPRTRPVKLKGIGRVHLPITTANPEVQKWFDQGVTLLHSFWDYEAERAFRWCLKLEPDNAMVYWGLARAAGGKRSEQFIQEAAKRKEKVSERERLYIEALEAQQTTDRLRDRSDDWRERNRDYKKILETITIRYPDDMEARALLALANMGDSRYGTELIIREILQRHPDHPGAHHYRIHNWNYHEPAQALESCRRYGEIAPGIGHALHMPGHIYATTGMWHEAAIAMDAATRVEIRRMSEQLVFPFNYWNYGHNRHYLNYIQEQLGMADAAIAGARQLIDAPLDPDHNSDTPYSSHSQGMASMLRTLVKFERWEDLLDSRTFPWRGIFLDKMNKSYAETRAWLGLGRLDKALKTFDAHAELKSDLEKNKGFEEIYGIQQLELKARLALAEGNTLAGLGLLSEAAGKQYEMQKGDNDPPRYPEVLYSALGRAYLESRSPDLAIAAFEKALDLTSNDWIALAGLAEASQAASRTDLAQSAMARLRFVTSEADKGLRLLDRALSLGIAADPKDNSPAAQRNYATTSLNRFGPAIWEPYPAPRLDATNTDSGRVALEEQRGKNVIVVFYLGRECLHCMNQLQSIAAKKSDWDRLDTVVLALSGNAPEANREALRTAKLDGITLLSDTNHENARRFQSYDDFEDMEIHSTILIDKAGRVHWARTGGEPFTNMEFLLKEAERMNILARPTPGGATRLE
jgi:peroxiredoxin/tetratricopeptide (TPR) repeat protein